jgi:hypothetical protein
MEFRNVLIKHTKSPLFKEKCARSANRRLAIWDGLNLKLVLYLKIKSLTERLGFLNPPHRGQTSGCENLLSDNFINNTYSKRQYSRSKSFFRQQIVAHF